MATTMAPSYDAFMSFESSDGKDFAHNVQRGLCGFGVRAFADMDQTSSSAVDHEAFLSHIQCVVVVLTKQYKQSLAASNSICARDLQSAITLKRDIVAVCPQLDFEAGISKDNISALPLDVQQVISRASPIQHDQKSGENFFKEVAELVRISQGASSPTKPGSAASPYRPSLMAELALKTPPGPVATRKKRIVGVESPRILKGHNGAVLCLRFSPDSYTLATGGVDHSVRQWDVTSGQLRGIFSGHTSRVTALAYIGSGTILFSGSRDKNILVWDLLRSCQRGTLTGHTLPVTSIAVHVVGQVIISGGHDGTLRWWHVMTSTLQRTLPAHTAAITAVLATPDGRHVISAGADKLIRVWSMETGELVLTLTGHVNYVSSIALSPDGMLLASGSWDETVKIWTLADGACTSTMVGHSSKVSAVTFAPDGDTVVSAGGEETNVKLMFWRISSATSFLTQPVKGGEITAVAVSSDGNYVAASNNDASIHLYKSMTI